MKRLTPIARAETVPIRLRKSIILSVLIVVVLWFGLNAAWNTRKMQYRMKCAANLKSIAAALKAYDAKFNDRPLSLALLGDLGFVDASELWCPIAKSSMYQYLPWSSSKGASPDEVLVYEPVGNHVVGSNVLFGDGRCNFVPKDKFEQLNIKSER